MKTNQNFENKVIKLQGEIEALETLRAEVRKRVFKEVLSVTDKIENKKRQLVLLEAEWRDWLLKEVRNLDEKKYGSMKKY